MNGSSQSSRTRRQQKIANLFGLLVVLFMLFTSVFSTIGSIDPVAAAQPDCPDGQELDDQGECVDIVEDDSTDSGDEDSTNDIYDAQAATGWLDVYKFECPSDFDSENAGLEYLSSECTDPQAGVYFELYDTSGTVGSGSTGGDGQLSFTDLAQESHSLAEDVAEGYGTPYVYCAVGDSPGSEGEYQSYDVIDGYYVDLDYSQYLYYSCYWFNIPEYYGGITVYKYVCDSQETVLTRGEWGWSDYQTNCQGDLGEYDDFAFELNDSSGVPTSQLVGDQIPNGVFFDEYEYGQVSITELDQDGWGIPIVFCGVVPAGSDAPLAPEETSVDESWTVSFNVDEGEQYACYWFNVPDYNGITIYKYICDDGYDGGSGSFPDLWENCTETWDGAPFHLSSDSGYDSNGESGDDGPGTLTFTDLDEGQYTLEEEVPDGYGDPYIVCAQRGFASLSRVLESGAEDLPALVASNSYDFHYEGTGQIYCYVFNLVDYNYGLDIYKWECPADYDYASAEYNDLVTDCSSPQNDVQFDIELADGAVASGTTGADDPGLVKFTGYTGVIDVTESIPEGYGTPVVYCAPQSDDQTYASTVEKVEVDESGKFTVNVAENEYWICYVFNFPTDDHDITIYKYYCEEAYDAAQYDYDWYFQNCNDWHDGATFSIGGESKAIEGSESVWYDDVPHGDLTITEQHEEGYGTPVVYCWQAGEDTTLAEPKLYEVTETGEWTAPYQEGYRLICYVYNIPTDHDITVYKYICPYGYNYEQASIEDLYENCEVVAIPIPFRLYDGDTELEMQETGAILAGGVAFDGYEASGGHRIVEEVPDGYDQPRVFCRVETTTTEPILFASSELTEYDVVESGVVLGGEAAAAATYDYGWYCEWFNFEGAADDNTLTIHKWECPVFGEDEAWEDTQSWLLENCTESMEGVDFNLDDLAGPRSLTTGADGIVTWTDVNNGPVTVTETIPEGYGQPSVFCGWSAFYNGAIYDAFPQKVDAPDGVWTTAFDIPNTTAFCDWFNFPDQPGDITIYKFWCPEGYDLYAYGADPEQDCKTFGEGIEFSLNGESKQTDSEGTVFWGDLEPGTYTVSEVYPSELDYSFVLNCYGGRYAGIQPYPLQFEKDLDVKVVSGDRIFCYWYNVPYRDNGWVTVYKYWCTTKTYKSDIDCQVYEGGVTFELHSYPGDDLLDEKTTDGYGKATFGSLGDGEYTLTEKGYKWCAIDISSKGADDSIKVTSGKETVVKIYNCDLPEDPKDPGIPKKPQGKVPTKYPNTGAEPTSLTLPNTGVGPIQGADMSIAIMLAVATALALAAGGFVLRHRRTDIAKVDSSTSADSLTTRRLVVGAAIGALGIPFVVAAQGDGNGSGDGDGNGNGQGDGTPEGTPDVPQCREDATPDAADPDEDPDCIRGEVPKHIKIEVIGVDADIEIQEIIAGEMQDPTGPTLVTWYKETTRLGERGNGVYAGHLNYWGVPEGVFFAIKQLQPGDEIVLTGENDEEFVYAVEYVENQPGQDDPDPKVLGLTEKESITLITCGGEWDTTIAEYNERTAVRAVRQPAQPA